MRTTFIIILGFFLLLSPLQMRSSGENVFLFSSSNHHLDSLRSSLSDVVVVADSDPFYSILCTSIACWYEQSTNTTALLPFLVSQKNNLTCAQTRFLHTCYPPTNNTILVVGEHLMSSYPTIEIVGSAPEVAISLATYVFTTAPSVLILPYTTVDAYKLSLLSAPLASYLNMPILIADDNDEELQNVCTQLHTIHAFVVGNTTVNLSNVTITRLRDEEAIHDAVLSVIKDQFGAINYMTMTNPSDVISPAVLNTTQQTISDHIINKKIIILSRELDILGNDSRKYPIQVPDGIQHVRISGELLQKSVSSLGRFSVVSPLLFMTLTDSDGHVVAYANSLGYENGKTYLETLICNSSGEYWLSISVYHGFKGGFFLQRGVSFVNLDVILNVTMTGLNSPHLPVIPHLSSLAPYLTAAHGGLIIANASWELTDSVYATAAQGSGSGPWYNEALHPFVNEKVNRTVQQLEGILTILDEHDLLSGYLNGPAWLAILADTTMIPMYYYSPSQGGIPEKGLPSDNPYTLSQNLSVGRLIGWDVQDVSVLIARTFFYETVCGAPENPEDWHHRFSFVFGEGFGETGGLFHQVPYAKEIRQYGFNSRVYGIFRNSRQFIEMFDVFTGANYIEYLGHGDWFWLPASFYGFDMYSKAVDVAHVKDWVFERPSVFLTSACLMGRTDGLPPEMTIGLTLLHAGCNGFVGATRETGQESGLSVLENHLIVDNWSVGEALRGEKRTDTELPTFYVRVLYGDPAFNPYEPQHRFSIQGRPVFLHP
ncbi:MAG: hypothetical protein JW840_03980 [Candidatus Thermoplasmatota archaeon]|nr:hypothetical protein [Candidatus Thermoplasmatota archaeon]